MTNASSALGPHKGITHSMHKYIYIQMFTYLSLYIFFSQHRYLKKVSSVIVL